MEEDLDSYLEVFVSGVERGSAPTTERTSEMDLNVPLPVLPGHLGQYTQATRAALPGTAVRRAGTFTTARRAAALPQPPLMFSTAVPPAAKAGSATPPPSPAMSATPPPPPDAPPPPPDAPSNIPATNRITTNYTTAPTSPSCPPCNCPGGISTGSILLLLAAAGGAWYLLTDKQ